MSCCSELDILVALSPESLHRLDRDVWSKPQSLSSNQHSMGWKRDCTASSEGTDALRAQTL